MAKAWTLQLVPVFSLWPGVYLGVHGWGSPANFLDLATRHTSPCLAMSSGAALVRFMRTGGSELPHKKPPAEPPKRDRANHFRTDY